MTHSSAMKISFVVPTKNSDRTLEACLVSLRQQVGVEVEIIVVDNSSTDGTPEIARRLADVVETFGPERSAQRNRGTALSTGDVVVFVDSDMTFERAIAADLVDVLMQRSDVGAVIIPERSFGEGFFAQCRVLEKSYIWHDEGQIRLSQTFAKKRYYGRWIAEYLRTHQGAGQRKLARTALFSQPGLLARHPMRSGGMFLLKGVEGAGLVAGMRDERKRATALAA